MTVRFRDKCHNIMRIICNITKIKSLFKEKKTHNITLVDLYLNYLKVIIWMEKRMLARFPLLLDPKSGTN